MPGDPYYQTPHWRALRLKALQRDGHRCVVPGCYDKAIVVDHIISRKANGPDTINNLRSLCRYHDNQFKELNGKRRAEKARIKGCQLDGTPNDPKHGWFYAQGGWNKVS